MKNLFLVTALIVYNFLFWQEQLGVNLPLFTLLLTAMLIILNPDAVRSRNVWFTVAGTLLTGYFIAWHNSLFTKWIHFISFFIMTGFIHRPAMRSIGYALINTVVNYFEVPLGLPFFVRRAAENNRSLSFTLNVIRLSIIPVIVLLLFYLIYFNANPEFEKYTENILNYLLEYLDDFFSWFTIWKIPFLVSGIFLIAGIVYNREIGIFLKDDLSLSDKLVRIRELRKKGSGQQHMYFNTISLKNENRSGVILLSMVNLLLLIVNIIDIDWIWFGFTVPEKFNLKQFVHEGSYLLILSILLSMVLLLYLFRENQNFYKKTIALKLLSYAWITQNAILCVSVFLRNYHYISYHGLAFKRIGVIIFLVMTMAGLFLLFLKIRNRLSFYFLIRQNLWSVYTTLAVSSLFNWSFIIADHNLNHWNRAQIDVDFYQELSDGALPLLHANLPKIKNQIVEHQKNAEHWISFYDYDEFEKILICRSASFLRNYKKHTWLSYSRAERKAYEYFYAIQEKKIEKILKEQEACVSYISRGVD